jgi:type IV secretion system protein VirB9
MTMRIGLALMLFTAPMAHGQVRPQPGMGNPHIQTVDFAADQVVTLELSPGYQVTVELSPDERVENVAIGDAGAWQVVANHAGNRLFVKPTQAASPTNMVVVTNTRTYHFALSAIETSLADAPWSVKFRYPNPLSKAPNDPAKTSAIIGRYRVAGDKALRPTGVDDDGAHTYIRWPDDRPLPAIYARADGGAEALVDTAVRDGLIVIDSVHPRIIFRIDGRSATAIRMAAEQQ